MASAKEELWKSIGIYDAIMITKNFISVDKPLFYATAQFWSVTTNRFDFRAGMMAPTIQDICFLTGFHAHGMEANCFMPKKAPI